MTFMWSGALWFLGLRPRDGGPVHLGAAPATQVRGALLKPGAVPGCGISARLDQAASAVCVACGRRGESHRRRVKTDGSGDGTGGARDGHPGYRRFAQDVLEGHRSQPAASGRSRGSLVHSRAEAHHGDRRGGVCGLCRTGPAPNHRQRSRAGCPQEPAHWQRHRDWQRAAGLIGCDCRDRQSGRTECSAWSSPRAAAKGTPRVLLCY